MNKFGSRCDASPSIFWVILVCVEVADLEIPSGLYIINISLRPYFISAISTDHLLRACGPCLRITLFPKTQHGLEFGSDTRHNAQAAMFTSEEGASSLSGVSDETTHSTEGRPVGPLRSAI